MALASEAVLLVFLILRKLVLHGVLILFALLSNPRQEAPERLILFEVVAVEFVHKIEVLGLVIPVLLPLNAFRKMLGGVLLLVA